MQSDDILRYYRREMAYLRQQAADFAQRYPKVAGGLLLHGGESPDPHVERLLESFAFLSARVHREIDQAVPQLATALLENLCPALAQAVPSMSVVQLRLDASQGKVTAGFPLARGTELVARASGGQTCRFQTAWDSELWPLRLGQARLLDEQTLSLELCSEAGARLSELDIRRLRVHVSGDWMEAAPLYEWLVAGVLRTSLVGETSRHEAGDWRELGFEADEDVLRLEGYGHPAHTLLRELFAFPRKFHFFELELPQGLPFLQERCEMRLTMRQPLRGHKGVGEGSFRLGCVPVINRFALTSEPLTLDGKTYEYPLAASWPDAATVEILSVERVYLSDPMAERTISIPHFAAVHHQQAVAPPMFWTSRRQASLRPYGGTDTLIGFVDVTSRLARPGAPVAYARLWCSNRRRAEQVPAGAKLYFDKVRANLDAVCLYEPTVQRDPPLGGEQLWQLAGFVTTHQQSLFESDGSSRRLQEVLRLFAGDSPREIGMIQGLLHARATRTSLPARQGSWRGYLQGSDVVLEFDPDAYAGSSPLLLAAVLARYFALTTVVNAFVRTTVRQGDGVWHSWPAMTGYEAIL